MVLRRPATPPLPEDAASYLEAKGLRPSFSSDQVWREEHATAFTVAKVLEKDLLADVQASLTRALREGQTFAQWSRGIKATLDKSGWSAYVSEAQRPRRLYTIYDTNMRVARAVGQWQRIQRSAQTRPYLEYQHGGSEDPRPEHLAWDGLVLPASDPWWLTHFPPNGWGCSCRVRQLSEREVEDLGGPDEPPEVEYVEHETADGETVYSPEGVDPGWDYNPGVERAQKLAELESILRSRVPAVVVVER